MLFHDVHDFLGPAPDLVLLLDLDPTSGRTRIGQRSGEPDDFEGAAYLAEVRRIFLSIDRSYIQRIEAARDQESVFRDAVALLEEAFRTHGIMK